MASATAKTCWSDDGGVCRDDRRDSSSGAAERSDQRSGCRRYASARSGAETISVDSSGVRARLADDLVTIRAAGARACIKKRWSGSEGSDAQAEMRGRLFRIGQKLGLLAWDEVVRAERALVASQPKRSVRRCCILRRCGSKVRRTQLRAVDAAGQALRMTYFPAGRSDEQQSRCRPHQNFLCRRHPPSLSLSSSIHSQRHRRNLARGTKAEPERAAKLVTVLDNPANQLTEAGAPQWAAKGADRLRRRTKSADASVRPSDGIKKPQTERCRRRSDVGSGACIDNATAGGSGDAARKATGAAR